MNTLKSRASEKIFQWYQSDTLRKTLRLLHVNSLARFFYFSLFKTQQGSVFYSVGGVDARFQVADEREREYILSGANLEYHNLQELEKLVKTGDVIYDIGAAVGFHMVFLAKKVGATGRIVAFEPDSHRYETLRKNIQLNDLNNVMPFNLALSNVKQKGFLSRVEGSDLRLDEAPVEGAKGQAVEITPGDEFVREKNLPGPNVVKIDVEGFEYFVIQGLEKTLRNDSCKVVCCEIHPNQLPTGVKPEMVCDTLKSFGFGDIKTYPLGNTFHIICRKV